MTKCIFVTATNTDAGKTYVSSLLLNVINKKYSLTMGFKPIASGDYPYNPDAQALQRLARMKISYEMVNPWCFAPPIAPHIAAAREGITLTDKMLSDHLNRLRSQQPELILTEGAGGWLLPLNEQQTLNEWVVAEKMGVILVVAMELGCLNHALLTARAIEQDGGLFIGWIANQPRPQPMAEYAENLAYLKAHLNAPCLAEVDYTPLPDQAELPLAAQQRLFTAIDCMEHHF